MSTDGEQHLADQRPQHRGSQQAHLRVNNCMRFQRSVCYVGLLHDQQPAATVDVRISNKCGYVFFGMHVPNPACFSGAEPQLIAKSAGLSKCSQVGHEGRQQTTKISTLISSTALALNERLLQKKGGNTR